MIDIVGLETGAYKLLHKIGFFVTAFGRTEARHGRGTKGITHMIEFGGGKVEGFFPCGLAEMSKRVASVKWQGIFLGNIITPDQWLCQAFRIGNIVKPITAFNAEPTFVCGAFTT